MDKQKLKRRTARLSVFSNTLLVVLKLAAGLYVGAMSLVSEALHSGIDLVAALIAFFAVRASDLPPDVEHDYGHGKYENISAAIEALLIVAAAIGIVHEAVDCWADGTRPRLLEYGIAVMGVSIAVNYWVSGRLIKVARLTDSQALEADGLHLRADIWTSVGVLLGLAAIKLTGFYWLDPIIAIGVAAIIFHAGWDMVLRSVRELTDASLSEEDEEKLGRIFSAHSEVLGFHCLRTRKSGTYRLLDVHILFDGSLPLSRVHGICDELEKKVHEEFGAFDVLIHPEPAEEAEEESKASHFAKSRLDDCRQP